MPEILFKFDKFRVLTEHLFRVIFMMFAIPAFQVKLSMCVPLYIASPVTHISMATSVSWTT